MRIRRFRGEEQLKVDAKGRVSVPAPLRRVLEAQDPDCTDGRNPAVVIVYGRHLKDRVECYSVDTMSEIEAKVDRMKKADPQYKNIVENLLTMSQEIVIDETGRIVLNAKLRKKIGIEAGGTVVFAGTGKTFSIWHPDKSPVGDLDAPEDDPIEPDVDAMEAALDAIDLDEERVH